MAFFFRKKRHNFWKRTIHFFNSGFSTSLWAKIDAIGFDKVMEEKKELQYFVQMLTKKCILGYFENKDLSPEYQVYPQPGVKVLGIKVGFFQKIFGTNFIKVFIKNFIQNFIKNFIQNFIKNFLKIFLKIFLKFLVDKRRRKGQTVQGHGTA